jgi:peroxiredoxin
MLRMLIMSLLMLLPSAAALAGEHNDKLDIGDEAPAWKNLPGTDEKQHSLSDLADKKAVVVVFTCNSCPVAADYEDRINEFAKKHAGDVAVVAINVSREDEDSLPEMQERAAAKGFSFPYLRDESQQIARDYGANATPEFFVLSPDRKIVYMGAMDDSAVAKEVKTSYLEPALRAALAGGKPEVAETYAHGCRIRYARERKRKD